uniref:DExD/H-box helicase 60 n=3 Tax=Callorhinchus milii TaxID=7868 RepID=A0A4W3H4H8_CALMI
MIEHVEDSTFRHGQNLHLFYLVERFLADLTNKGAKYVIVFFKDAESMWSNNFYLLSLRMALILHLQNNTEVPVFSDFTNCFSSKWQDFLHENYPYFIMISDQAYHLANNKDVCTYMLDVFIYHTLGNEINVVLTSGMCSDVRRVYGYHVTSKSSGVATLQKGQKKLERAYKAIVSTLSKHFMNESIGDDQKHRRNMQEEVKQDLSQLQCLLPDGSDIRRLVCVVSCSVTLKCFMNTLKTTETSQIENAKTGTSNVEKDQVLSFEEAKDLCRLYCVHVALLIHLPLTERAQKTTGFEWSKPLSHFLELQNMCGYLTLKNIGSTKKWSRDMKHLCDLSDKLLFTNVVLHSRKSDLTEFNIQLGEVIEGEYQRLWDTVSKLASGCDIGKAFPLQATTRNILQENDHSVNEGPLEVIPEVGLIPLNIPLVNEYASDILKDLCTVRSNTRMMTSLARGKEFDERVHWHSSKKLSDDFDRTKSSTMGEKSNDPEVRKQMLRNYQKLVRFHRLYGSTLEGNITKNIVTTEQGIVAPKKQSSNVSAGKSKKLPPKKKADIIAEENIKKKQEKEDLKLRDQWNLISRNITKEIFENFDYGVKKLDEFLKKCSGDTVKLIAEMDVLDSCFILWVDHCQTTETAKRNNKMAVEVLKRIQNIMDKYEKMLEKNQLKQISAYLKELGLNNLAQTIPDFDQKPLKSKATKKNSCEVGVESARFQLTYMGPYLIREERSDPDPRITHFIPDTWQRELLDAVDNNESAVIVAPTSSGKTYASYYCMEKVLKDSDDGVLVYVAPTKALVNQVIATVYNRFNKALPDGMVVCGVFTRDYRQDALNSQILITVPQCLEILMLAPQRQAWVKKIRYVIFDEVHCLGGEIGAEVWEHLLVMIRCPFLALSATIGNPEDLAQWLQSVKHYWEKAEKALQNPVKFVGSKRKQMKMPKDQRSYKVRLVTYGERYNDLEKYVCDFQTDGVDFASYHPCAALTLQHIEKYGFPSDLALSPPESLRLYDTMVQIWPAWPRAQEFCPERYKLFKDKIVIKKGDVRKYEAELKREFLNWIKNGQKEQVAEVLNKLKPKKNRISDKNMVTHFPLMVDSLRKMDRLPALFFSFSISTVERLAKAVFVHATEKERLKRKPDDEKKRNELENKLRKLAKRVGKKQPSSEPKVSISKADNMVLNETEQERLQHRLEEMNKIPEDCTYAVETAADSKLLQIIFRRLQYVTTAPHMRSYLERGIGYHHSSLNTKARQAVEMLFRLGFARVVTATGSLALGINMPCKTVVFLDDSVFLDALQYRQMSGRAGRRGLDVIGNVLFYNIPMPKVQRLLKASVPTLKGQFPINVSLVLRLMLLVAMADDKMDAQAKTLSLLQHSLLYYNQPKNQVVLKLYFLFCTQFLVQEGFLDQEGTPHGFAGLVTHLHYHEPANFVFVSFLVKGLFHKICSQPQESAGKDAPRFSEEVMETLVLILANLFGRIYLPSCSTEEGWAKFHQSKVFLDDLPQEFADAVDEYNQSIQETFGCFLLSASKQADMLEECQLPLSRITSSGVQRLPAGEGTLVADMTTPGKHPTNAVSPFARLSGITNMDLFQTYHVDNIALRTIDINSSNIPLLGLKKYDSQGRKMPLNAYALDFYKHGSLKALMNDNMLHLGDAYVILNDFRLVLNSIRTSLKELCDNKEDHVVLAFEQLNESYYQKFEKIKS